MAENKTFKYLDNKQSQGPNAAQDFLNEKLAKNKYMDTSNPDNPYSYGEGTTPDGTAYNPPAEEPKKSNGIKNSMSAEEQREKFGLIYDGEKEYTGDPTGNNRLHDDKGNIWYKEGDQVKYLGQVAGFTRGSTGKGGVERTNDPTNRSDISKGIFGDENADHHTSTKSLLQKAHDERLGGAGNHDNGFNSINDLAASMKYMLEKSAPAKEPEPEKAKPIEHSAEIKQAKDRVQQFETDAWSGKTSNEIYGKGETLAKDKYNFDASLGASGIGASPAAKADANSAAASFLNKKVADTKKKLQLS